MPIPASAPGRPCCRGLLPGPLPLLVALLAAGVLRAEEPALTPVTPTRPRTGLVDPMQPARLSAVERDRLYQQVTRDAEQLEQQGRHLRRLVELLRPTVVHIDAARPAARPRPGKPTESETGSGVIATVAGKTVVLTNRHVVHGSELQAIAIRLDDGREINPRQLWSDAGTDIAVLEIAADDVQPARLASGDTLQIGDMVLAIGSPFGLANSVTLGIVSAKGRRDLEVSEGTVKFQDFLQTDAAINPGNSGGPLVNLRGEVVGINSCIASTSGANEGIGFAIPVPMVAFVAGQLVENGAVSRAYLGVALDKKFSPQAASLLGMVRPVGARVLSVTPGAPAEGAGIRSDDVILEFDGTAVEDDDHLMSLVSMTPVHRTVEVVIFRDRRRLPLRIPVASRDEFE